MAVAIGAAAAARVDPVALAVMAVLAFLPILLAVAVAVAQVDRHPLLVQQEQPPLAVLVVRGELQALGVLGLHRLVDLQPTEPTAVAAAVGLEIQVTREIALMVLHIQ